jgi:hypothetical protein
MVSDKTKTKTKILFDYLVMKKVFFKIKLFLFITKIIYIFLNIYYFKINYYRFFVKYTNDKKR